MVHVVVVDGVHVPTRVIIGVFTSRDRAQAFIDDSDSELKGLLHIYSFELDGLVK